MTANAAAAEVRAAWRQALALWDAGVNLSPPEAHEAAYQGDDPLAYIDLNTRQVRVNFGLLDQHGIRHCLPGILAHELGHHVRFPHTLRLAADLHLMEKRLLPGLSSSLTNLFFDLQVNEVVGRTLHSQLCDVYRSFRRQAADTGNPVYNFYLAIYEELWALPAGDLLPEGATEAMNKAYPGWRIEARVFAQTFYALADDYLQFAYFCGRFARYQPPQQNQPGAMPLANDVPQPGADDYEGAVWGNPLADAAVDEAVKRGWLEGGVSSEGGDAALRNIGRAAAGMPGNVGGPFREAMVSAVYRRVAERHLVKYPRLEGPEAPDAFLPTTTVPWEFGDDPRAIDWTQSVLAAGALAAALPLQREFEPDAPRQQGRYAPPLEIYLDTSGSMPAPGAAMNAMTLAAQILSMAAIRAGSKVRGVVYSAGPYRAGKWLADEELSRRWLLHYVGGGTEFPFKELVHSATVWPGVLRVIISDTDFLYNINHIKDARKDLATGIERSLLMVAMLRSDGPTAGKELREFLAMPRFRLAPVADASNLGRAAAALASVLFDS
ncbi:MAG: hypothetical protein IT463_06010 [Planctomycetes bacterium]|nr:hypothetical protein [Planctomycetota bacterium]